jgi:hypothetical protein
VIGSDIKSQYQSYIWHPGWNVSNRRNAKLDLLERKHKCIREGIHVFLDLPCCYPGPHIVIPVTCFKGHFVAIGEKMWHLSEREAVFTKVFLKKVDYHNAIKEYYLRRIWME